MKRGKGAERDRIVRKGDREDKRDAGDMSCEPMSKYIV